jgi:hypothetical protein
VNPSRAADIFFACGAPGSGKSYAIKAELERRDPPRLIVIDPDGEYVNDGGVLHDSLSDVLKATGYATFRTRLRPSFERRVAEHQFDIVCRLVRWHADPQPGQALPPAVGPVVFVVDELADYVGPSFRDAPESWQWLIRRGRKYGVSLLAASQRPAQIDKTLFDLASTIRTGRLNNADSQRVVAAALDVPTDRVAALTGHEFIERDKNNGRLWSTDPAIAGGGITDSRAKPRKR